MRLVPLPGRTETAVRVALLSHGWEGDLSVVAARGLESLAFELTRLESGELEALVTAGGRLGLDVVTGPDWAILSGPRARLSALARPWVVPEALTGVAIALGHALPAEEPRTWHTAAGPIRLEGPVIMGILNATPDSFSDGARYQDPAAAADRAGELVAGGASIIDIGGESTRPGSARVSPQEELDRVLPVVEAVVGRVPGVFVSIDTTRATVARAALDRGAVIVNDVSGLRADPAIGPLCAERGAGLVLMHSRGEPGNLAADRPADYPEGVLAACVAELGQARERARLAGVPEENVVVDPGLGFGKTADQSVELLRGIGALRALGRPILIGPSRKRFLGALTGRPVEQRDAATAGACALGWLAGAAIFRVHQPGPVRDALAVAAALEPR